MWQENVWQENVGKVKVLTSIRMSKSMLKTTHISWALLKSAFHGVPDGHDVQVGAGAGSHVDPEGAGQNQIRSESPL